MSMCMCVCVCVVLALAPTCACVCVGEYACAWRGGSVRLSGACHSYHVASTLRYTLEHVIPSNLEKFVVDARSGAITTATSFDFNTEPIQYLLRVNATDGAGTSSLSASVLVTVRAPYTHTHTHTHTH